MSSSKRKTNKARRVEPKTEDPYSSGDSDMDSNELSPAMTTSPKPADKPSSEVTNSTAQDSRSISLPGTDSPSPAIFPGNGSHLDAKPKVEEGGLLENASKPELMEEGSRDDDDEDDDAEDEKLAAQSDDPEKLKAFNMFVRLFVDENLDRMVPICSQPKEKIQAILEACTRQFPEYGPRARKRIRTYLKSCRRFRRNKDQTTVGPLRPPPHLSSAAAEGLLAQACDNECKNAKRMRMGMEPLAAGAMTQPSVLGPVVEPQPKEIVHITTEPSTGTTPSFLSSNPVFGRRADLGTMTFHGNGNALFRPGFPMMPTPSVPTPSLIPVLTSTAPPSVANQNDATDLTTKNTHDKMKQQLTNAELIKIRSLINGYRESASFLNRSADELEQLLLQHK